MEMLRVEWLVLQFQQVNEKSMEGTQSGRTACVQQRLLAGLRDKRLQKEDRRSREVGVIYLQIEAL